MKGRLPKPAAIRKAEGNLGHRPIPQEADFPTGIPDKPPLSPAGEEVWNELIGQMAGSGVLKQTDGRALAALAEDEALLSQAYAGLWATMGHLAAAAKAKGKELPGGPFLAMFGLGAGRIAMSAIRDLANRLIVERREFGLTPSARVRVSADPQSVMDEWEIAQCESTGMPLQ